MRSTSTSSAGTGSTSELAADAAGAAEAWRAASALLVLPPASAEERAQLRESLRSEGPLVPIVLSAGPACAGEVADGRLRAELCRELGLDCPVERRGFASELEFERYRLLTNLKRRQLPDAQRIRLGLALEPYERARAAERKAQAKGGRRGEKALPVALPEEKGETRQRVARAVGLRPSTYSRGAKVLREGSPELVADFDAGRETPNSAYRRLQAELLRTNKQRLARELEHNPPQLPAGRYQVLALDPPWPELGQLPYPTMELAQIAALPIPDLLTADAIVWLWTTNRHLFDAERIAREHWQLERRAILTWAKDKPGTGPWLRGQTEHCLLYSQGRPLFLGGPSTLLTAPARQHSRKPDEFYELVEQTCPGSKLELFAREQRPGWHAWGAETTHFPTNTTGSGEQAA
jgi:N6-adenosine-specific RNA methylase IME4